jgi:hypothetical protein
MLQHRLVSLNISLDFVVLGKVMRKKRMFAMVAPSADDLRMTDIFLTLVTSKPRFTNPRPPLQEL